MQVLVIPLSTELLEGPGMETLSGPQGWRVLCQPGMAWLLDVANWILTVLDREQSAIKSRGCPSLTLPTRFPPCNSKFRFDP